MTKLSSRIAMAIALLLVVLELFLRAIGMVDFPLYDVDARIGYIPKASQEGSFLWRNTWVFNELSMGTARNFDVRAVGNDVLLVGDSIVLGGNTLPQDSKLAPRMEIDQAHHVWPIAAGSWALRNELQYLKDHPEVARSVGRLILVLNSADFGEASSWACELTHPRRRPSLALLYVAKKYGHDWAPCGAPPQELMVPPGDWRGELQDLVRKGLIRPADTTVILYPTRKEAGDHRLMAQALESRIPELKAALGSKVRFISVGQDPRWTTNFYRDDIHPSVEGYGMLAKIIGAGLARDGEHQ